MQKEISGSSAIVFQSQDTFLLAVKSEEASHQAFCLVSDPIPVLLLLCSAPQGANSCKLYFPGSPANQFQLSSIDGWPQRKTRWLEEGRNQGISPHSLSLSFLTYTMKKPIDYLHRVSMRNQVRHAKCLARYLIYKINIQGVDLLWLLALLR